MKNIIDQPNKIKYIAYYRVSTHKQEVSGLGLEAQKRDVMRHIRDVSNLVGSYSDKETTGSKNDRPELKKAIDKCIELDATLIIAKLSRLSRDVSFIYQLINSNVKFVCADMPNANNLTIGLLAVVAQNELETTSTRTKESLESINDEINKFGYYITNKGRKIYKLGYEKNFTNKGRKLGATKMKLKSLNNEENIKIGKIIKMLKDNGNTTYYSITKKLNELGIKTIKGKDFNQVQVKRIYNKYY